MSLAAFAVPPRLTKPPSSPGQNVFFHRNHPIQWVRVSGIVTAIDEFAGRRAYTIDDGSGATMECHVLLSEVAKSSDAITLETKPNASAAPAKIIVMTPINTGDIIDVKGTIRVYRDMKQIKAEKMVLVRTTEQEVQFWEKVVKLRREVLDRPWVLDPRVVRRCRKEEEGEQRHRAKKRTRSPSAAVERGQPRPVVTGLERRVKIPRTVEVARHRGEDQAARSEDISRANPMVTGLERVKPKMPRPVEVNTRPVMEQQDRAELGRENGALQSRPTATGLERRDKARRTADENSPWEPGMARDTSVVKPKPLATGLEKGRPSARLAEVKRHQEARPDPGQQRHLPRRDNFSVAPPQPKPLITGLEKGSAILRTAKRPVEPALGLQPSRSERPEPEPNFLVTGLEKKHKSKTKQPILVTGQYSALGL